VKPRSTATAILAFLALSAIGFAFVMWSLERSRSGMGRVECASQLRQIGQAARAYAVLHEVLPPNLETIYAESFGEADLPVFVCPQDPVATPGPPPFVPGRNLSYVYLGGGLKDNDVGHEDPLGYCLPANHAREGTHVLFGDGSVRWVDADELKRLGIDVEAP
jgi:hypothetical protein